MNKYEIIEMVSCGSSMLYYVSLTILIKCFDMLDVGLYKSLVADT